MNRKDYFKVLRKSKQDYSIFCLFKIKELNLTIDDVKNYILDISSKKDIKKSNIPSHQLNLALTA